MNSFERYVVNASRPMALHPLTKWETEVLCVSHALSGEVGEAQNLIKKALRDGQEVVTKKLLLEIGDVHHYLTRLILALGYTTDQIEAMNVDKLSAKQPRTPRELLNPEAKVDSHIAPSE